MYSYTPKINLKKEFDESLSAEDIFNKIKLTGEGYEVLSESTRVIPYFDYDYLYNTEEERADAFPEDLKRVETEIKECYPEGKLIIFTSNGIDLDKKNAEDKRPELLIAEQAKSRPNKRTIAKLSIPVAYYKNSINVIVRGVGSFESNQYIVKPKNGTFDKNVYKKYQLIRAPFASKLDHNRPKNIHCYPSGGYLDIISYEEEMSNVFEGEPAQFIEFEKLLISNTIGECDYFAGIKLKAKIDKEDRLKEPTLIDVSLDNDDDDSDDSEDSETTRSDVIPVFKTTKHLKHLLLCLKIDRIDSMDPWLLLMRVCKNIMKTFTDADDITKTKNIIHKHMEQTPDKYKFDEVENFLTKDDEIYDQLATWGTLGKMAKEDNPRHYEKILKLAKKIKEDDIFNTDRINNLAREPRKYYWSDYNLFAGKKFKTPDEILKYMIDTTYKIMNGGSPYFITMNRTFKEFAKKQDSRYKTMEFNYEYKTLISSPFNKSLKNYCIFELQGKKYDLVDFSEEFFQKYHFMGAEMLPYAGLDDPFKEFTVESKLDYKILNRFEGFRMAKYQLAPSDKIPTCHLMLAHIKNVICQDDKSDDSSNLKLYDYVIGWLAWLIQKPDLKHETCLLLQGIEGCGKNMFIEFVKRVIGEKICFDTYNIKDIIGDFNALLSGKLLIIGDELVGYAGFKKSDFIKGMLTSPNISITKKGVDTIAEKSFQRYIFTTNNEETLRISNNDRRICIVGVSSSMVGNREYFTKLMEEMNDLNNIKCLFDYLNTYDLTGYDFRKAPDTRLKTQTVNKQMDPIYEWFIDYSQGLPPVSPDTKSITLKSAVVHESFVKYTNNNSITKIGLSNKIKTLFEESCIYMRKTSGMVYIFDIQKTNKMFMDMMKNKEAIINVQEEVEEVVQIKEEIKEAPLGCGLPNLKLRSKQETDLLFSDDEDEEM